MSETVLITGGGGFIGSHVARALLAKSYRVRILDSLVEQVHGQRARPAGLPQGAEFLHGDVRNAALLDRALQGVDRVIHLAAEVGVGQSMYEVDRYVSGNDYGTAVLFQKLIERPVKRVVTASSMSIYGEGLYETADGALISDAVRTTGSPEAGWEPTDRQGRPLKPLPTPEWKQPNLASVYALTKYVQERLTLTLTQTYGMEGVALRLFNVYGPGQALSNPYTGVLAIFASRIMNGNTPLMFEDGEQRRDFVHVSDVARAFVTALEHPAAPGGVYNVGSGHHRSVRDVARLLAAAMGRNATEPEVVGKMRAGDIRHCFADVSKARDELGFVATKDFSEGMAELAAWLAEQQAVDKVDAASAELKTRGLVA